MKIKRADLAEPPPAGWEQLGLRPGAELKTFNDVVDLNRFCKGELGPANPYNPRAYYGGECWVPRTKTLALLTDEAAHDPEKQAARKVHGYTHSWGPVHPGGDTDWIWPGGKPVEPITPTTAEMMRSMALAEQQRLSAAVPRKPGSVPASTAVPIKGGR